MNVYQSLNLVEIKDGRLYFFNFPQSGQSFTEVQEILDALKKQIQELETNSKKTKPSDAVPEVPKDESNEPTDPTVVMDVVAPTGESEA